MIPRFAPIETIRWMIETCEEKGNNYILGKLRITEGYYKREKDKFNRWFGYYQKVGEIDGLWDLSVIVNMVRDEKQEFKRKYRWRLMFARMLGFHTLN